MTDTKHLTQLLEQKHEVLVQIHALAARQLDLADQGDASVMISLIAAKQGLIDGLMKIEQSLSPYREESPEERVWDSPDERARVAGVSQQCNELLQEVMALDRRGLERAQARQQQTKLQIDSAHQAASARNAYLTSQPASPSRIDMAFDA